MNLRPHLANWRNGARSSLRRGAIGIKYAKKASFDLFSFASVGNVYALIFSIFSFERVIADSESW